MKALISKIEKRIPTASGYTSFENMETAGITTTYYLLGILIYKSVKIVAHCPFQDEQIATRWEEMMGI